MSNYNELESVKNISDIEMYEGSGTIQQGNGDNDEYLQ